MTRFIDGNHDQFGLKAICRVLRATECGSSRGYPAAKQHPASARSMRDEMLIGEIRRVHAKNYGAYGYRKVHQAMRRAG